MPSLSDRLKALGVKVGAEELPPPKPRNPHSIEQILAGRSFETLQGEAFVVDEHYPNDFRQGQMQISIDAPLRTIAEWAGEKRISDYPPHSFAFIDTETTGLSGGTGTYAFLIGVGRFEEDGFHLAQFFMRDPVEEPAQLAAVEQFIAPCDAVVTFNGKAFDVPLLNSRFISQGWRSPFLHTAHVDLLHLARRLWSSRLPSRTLGNLEVQILGAARSEEDVPGWMIPSLFFQYLRDGDARPLKSVFYHNAMDVVSMSALFNHMAWLLTNPLERGVEHGADVIALAKLHESMGDLEAAIRLYLHGLEFSLPTEEFVDAVQRLAMIHKRNENFADAVPLWEQAARHNHLEAHLELAKYYEHRQRDFQEAIHWTLSAIASVSESRMPAYIRRQKLGELEHRLGRLKRKIENQQTDSGDSEDETIEDI